VAVSEELFEQKAREKERLMARHRERKAGELRYQFTDFMGGSQSHAL
jgi:hypothetical protein